RPRSQSTRIGPVVSAASPLAAEVEAMITAADRPTPRRPSPWESSEFVAVLTAPSYVPARTCRLVSKSARKPSRSPSGLIRWWSVLSLLGHRGFMDDRKYGQGFAPSDASS